MAAQDEVIEVLPLAGGAPVAIPAAQFEEWTHHVMSSVHAERPGGHSLKVNFGIEIEVNDAPDLPKLRVLDTQGHGLLVFAVLTREEQRDGVQAWERWLEEGLDRLGVHVETFDWRAVIGPDPTDRLQPNGQYIEGGPREVASLLLTPTTSMFAEHVTPAHPSLGARSTFWSGPVIVDGTSEGYTWMDVAATDAASRLHRLSVLVSIALGSHWIVRQSANVLTVPDAPRELPTHVGGEDPLDGDRGNIALTPQVLPDWISSGDAELLKNPKLHSAASMFHQALGIRPQSPSLALVAFVASIEGVAQFLKTAERCPTCQAVVGSRARFEAAVESVLAPEDAARLGKAYAMRSRTAHDGRLHGSEGLAGAMLFSSPFGPSETFMFEYDTVGLAQQAARALLIRELSGQSPKVGPAQDPPKGLIGRSTTQ